MHKEAELLAAKHEAAAQRRHAYEVEETLKDAEGRIKARLAVCAPSSVPCRRVQIHTQTLARMALYPSP